LSFARRAVVVCLLAAPVPAAQADEAKTKPAAPAEAPAAKATTAAPAAVPDDELLEFLGGVDSEGGDEDWLEYLSHADIVKVAKARKAAPAAAEGDEK
jgi:hypothetical protein